MKRSWMMGVAVATLASGAAVASDKQVLRADFDNQVLGQAPGTRGAAFGEPIATSGAVVDLAPLPTPNLRVSDTSECCGLSTYFEFLDGRELATGTVMVRASVLYTGHSQANIRLSPRGSFGPDLFQLYTSYNSTRLYAFTGTLNAGEIGEAPANQLVQLAIDLSPELRKVSVRLDGETLLENHDFTFDGERGVGRMFVGHAHNPLIAEDVMRLDDLRVIHCDSPEFADCIFIDGYD